MTPIHEFLNTHERAKNQTESQSEFLSIPQFFLAVKTSSNNIPLILNFPWSTITILLQIACFKVGNRICSSIFVKATLRNAVVLFLVLIAREGKQQR